MNYSKPAISIENQINKLKGRGLNFVDEELAKSYLSNISYYRLRAYTYPFQDNTNPNHTFTRDISFEQIIRLYVFDRKLRNLLFDALEKIEVSFRTQIIYNFALTHGSHWHLNKALYQTNRGFNYTLKKNTNRN